MSDVYLRRTWSLTKGKLIDECEVDNTPDSVLMRPLAEPDVELLTAAGSWEALNEPVGE